MSKDRYPTFLTLASLALAVLVVLLAWQNRDLKQELTECRTNPSVPADFLAAGDTFEAVPVLDPDGSPSRLDLTAGTSVVLVFSSTCPACAETLPLWNSWVQEGRFGDASVYAVRTDRPAPGAPSASGPAALLLPVHVADRSGADPLRRIYAVPCTLVVGPGGKVRVAVYGVPTEADADRVRDAVSN